MYYKIYHSPIGKLYLVSDGVYLTGCYLENQKYFPNKLNDWKENKDLMIVEYYDKDSIKNNDPHPYIYVFYYYYTLDNDFIFAEYFSKEKLSKDTLDKMSGQIFDRVKSF